MMNALDDVQPHLNEGLIRMSSANKFIQMSAISSGAQNSREKYSTSSVRAPSKGIQGDHIRIPIPGVDS